MGLYPASCSICKKTFMWFSGNLHQVCETCGPVTSIENITLHQDDKESDVQAAGKYAENNAE